MEKDDSSTPNADSPPSANPRRWRLTSLVIPALLSILCFYKVSYHPTGVGHGYTICSSENGIYTVDERNPVVDCLTIVKDRIYSTSPLDEIVQGQYGLVERMYGLVFGRAKVHYIDAKSIVVPGLADAHAHVLEYGFKIQLQLDGSQSVQEVISRVKMYILDHPNMSNDTWIEGMGWDQTRWPGAQFPTASDLDSDSMLSGRPILLYRVDGHAAWVSPRVIELIGNIPDKVDGGLVVRDESGKPTGVFVDNAMALIPRPEWTENRMDEYYTIAMSDALSHGLTSIHDADSSPAIIEFYRKKAKAGKLPIRLYVMGHLDTDDYWGSRIPRLIDYGKDQRLSVRSIKLFTDGALGSWGAALIDPYSDKPDTKGIMRSTPDKLKELIQKFQKDNWQNVHCIGDRANNVVLNIFEEIISNGANVTEWRPRIEHSQILTESDLDRIGKLGVIASVQPTHGTSDMWYAEKRLGPDRMKGAYAYQTLLKSSPIGILPLGSDFPVEGINPLLGFYAAVSRLSVDGSSPHGDGGWFPEQRLTRTQALKGMTLDAAYASFSENQRGSLVPGKKADFVILDRNIMTVPFDQILETKVLATVVDGKLAFGAL